MCDRRRRPTHSPPAIQTAIANSGRASVTAAAETPAHQSHPRAPPAAKREAPSRNSTPASRPIVADWLCGSTKLKLVGAKATVAVIAAAMPELSGPATTRARA